MAIAPNVACVAAAFAFGLAGLAVVLVSNFGTSVVYNRARRALHSDLVEDAWTLDADALCITGDEAEAIDRETAPESDVERVRAYA